MATPAVHPVPELRLRGATPGSRLDPRCDSDDVGPEISVEQYLHTAYDPDCDYVDGHLQERNLGEFDHGDVQGQVYYLFRTRFAEWQVRSVVEVRLQVRPDRFLIPDVMVLHPGQKKAQVIREAPLLCVEVLSPEDRWNRLKAKVDDYVEMGVRHIWAFDPSTREAYLCDREGFHRVAGELSVPGTAILLSVGEVFSVLDAE